MALIILETKIAANIQTCFDLARSIDLHLESMAHTNEKAVAGRMHGLCVLGDTITWRAKHFGITQMLTVEISKFDAPVFFEDRLIQGAFNSMRHEHHFKKENDHTLMIDRFAYDVPWGWLGKIFDQLVLEKYMTRLLLQRNDVLKRAAERSG